MNRTDEKATQLVFDIYLDSIVKPNEKAHRDDPFAVNIVPSFHSGLLSTNFRKAKIKVAHRQELIALVHALPGIVHRPGGSTFREILEVSTYDERRLEMLILMGVAAEMLEYVDLPLLWGRDPNPRIRMRTK